VHHIAFRTENIQQVVGALGADGLAYLLDLVGSEEEGLRQIFSVPSSHTMLVTEYIQRYGDFDGFFTRSNVERLTEATGRQ
jgi:4-hydroxyphenylpyruvate dioxygenase-like putative hemolysin